MRGIITLHQTCIKAASASDGVLGNPQVQGVALKVAAEEIRKALAVFERTRWK